MRVILVFAAVHAVLASVLVRQDANGEVSDDAFDKGARFKQHMLGLLTDIRNSQAKKSTDYSPRKMYPPLTWQRQEGLYDSFVHLNFHGDYPKNWLLRNGYRFPDDNSFVTIFVTEALIQAKKFYSELPLTSDEVLSAVKAVSTHRDQNSADGVPLYSFWNQVPVETQNGTRYRATPSNIAIPVGEAADGFSLIEKWLRHFGLQKYADVIKTGLSIEKVIVSAFNIPADSDDTGVSLALGGLLASNLKDFSQASEVWSNANSNVAQVFSHFKKYAYRPMGEYPANTIDPRTYLWIRGFVQEQAKKKNTGLALITTWMQSIDEIESQRSHQRMPFNLNNVDISVSANALFGITKQLLSQQDSIINAFKINDMEKMYIDNIELVCWALKSESVEKYPTHALLYYPPKFAFYWFVARLVNTLNSANIPSHMKFLGYARRQLSDAMEKFGVPAILKTMGSNGMYWDDFLGNGDVYHNKSKENHEDRVFSTAMAVNALIDTYTVTKDNQLSWRRVSGPVPRKVVGGASLWLLKHAKSYPKENAFFSASIKTSRGNPYYFPHNSFRWSNGSSAGKCSDFKSTLEFGVVNLYSVVIGVEGVIEEKEYLDKLESQVCFNSPVPHDLINFGLNCADCAFPYWSSPSMTNAMTLLALAKHHALK